MSEPMILAPAQAEEIRRLWAEGAPELECAAVAGCSMSTLRRLRSPGRQLSDLKARPHSARDSGRRTPEITPRLLWERCALIRRAWSPEEREIRSKGLLSSGRGPAEPEPEPGPSPRNHRLKIVPVPGHS
jgi:hypothetical protein